MKRKLSYLIVVILLFICAVVPVYGAKGVSAVKIQIPTFKVTLNGTEVNNSYSKYPLIVYNNITYFPMTYSDSRFLGLESIWNGTAKGLSIDATGVTAAYKPYLSASKNGASYTATIPTFPISINGKMKDNSKEQYPLLTFRDITYFPMTWKFAVTEFGWSYSFENQKGLMINSANIKLKQQSISKERAKNDGKLSDNVIIAKGSVYYEGLKGCIMQTSLSNLAKTKRVYQLPIWSYGGGDAYVSSRLYTESQNAYLEYHQGGGVMGNDYLIQLNDNGTTTTLNEGRDHIADFGDKSIKYWVGPTPGPGNLSIKTGSSDWKTLGSANYLYGWAWSSNETGSGGSGVDTAYLRGDDLYILAFDMTAKNSTTGIYKVALSTNEVKRVVDKEVKNFQIEGDSIYYESQGYLYRYSITNGKEELLKQLVRDGNYIDRFAVLNGNVYWKDGLNENLYKLNGENVNFGALLDDMKIAGDNHEYLVCTFQETDISKYRIMIFDKNGKVIFKTSDKAYCRNISIEGSKIYFYNITTGTICEGQL